MRENDGMERMEDLPKWMQYRKYGDIMMSLQEKE